MVQRIDGASTSYTSFNELGYVGLPREAVLDNSTSPAAQDAFVPMILTPPAVVLSYYNPPLGVPLLFFIASCGSPETNEKPFGISVGDAQGGTTDEGDGPVAPDNNTTDSGDAFVAADDSGMSLPDNGMTIAETSKDITEDVEDAPIAADGGMIDDGDVSKPDDGTLIAEVEAYSQDVAPDGNAEGDTTEAPDVPVATDSSDVWGVDKDGEINVPVEDAVVTSEVAPDINANPGDATGMDDVPVGIDSNGDDVVVTADAGAPVEDVEEGVVSLDMTSQQDGITDPGETASPCTPSCVPLANPITCVDGSINIAVSYFVKCATQFTCPNGIGTSKITVDGLKPDVDTIQSFSVDNCYNMTIFSDCQVSNDVYSDSCGAVKIEVKPKPNTPPTVDQLISPADKSLGVLPSGDQCFNAANSIDFSFIASDKDSDPITCGLKIYQNDIEVPAATVSATFNDLTKPLTLQLSANLLQPRTDYCWNVSCDDGKGGVAVAGGSACFTTSEKGLMVWLPFKEKFGGIAYDQSGNGLNAVLSGQDGLPTWTIDSVTGENILCLDGIDDFLAITMPDLWKETAALTFDIRFKEQPGIQPESFLLHWISDVQNSGISSRLINQSVIFGACVFNKISCTTDLWAASKTPLLLDSFYDLEGIINLGTFTLYLNGKQEDKKVNSTTNTFLGKQLFFGKHGQNNNLFSKVCLNEIRLYSVDTSSTCK